MFFARLGVLNWCHNRSHSPVLGLTVLYPTGSEIWCFWYIKTRERKIAMEKTFLLHLSAHWGDLIKQKKKICHIHFNVPQSYMRTKLVRRDLRRPYPRRLKILIIYRCYYNDSTFSPVILRPCVLVPPGLALTTSCSADRRSPYWAKPAAVEL